MAIVDEQQRTALIEQALQAIKEEQAEKGNAICRQIVETISSVCNQNQKEIAQELQTLAKSLETISSENEAFEFKQKTCAIMLEISMEERRKARVHGQGKEVSQNNEKPEEKDKTQPGPQTEGADSTESPKPPAGDPPRSKIIGLPSQTSVPQAPGTSNSNTFFSSKIIGAPSTSPPRELAPQADIAGGATSPETAEATAGNVLDADGQPAQEKKFPFKNLAYLYLGTTDYDATVEYYLEVLKSEKVWDFDRFGAKVTAFRLSHGPLVLVSNHRKAPGCQPVFEVEDLSTTVRELKERGWSEQAGPFGTPNGEAYSFLDPSGNSIAIFQVDPDSTDRSYVDPTEYD